MRRSYADPAEAIRRFAKALVDATPAKYRHRVESGQMTIEDAIEADRRDRWPERDGE